MWKFVAKRIGARDGLQKLPYLEVAFRDKIHVKQLVCVQDLDFKEHDWVRLPSLLSTAHSQEMLPFPMLHNPRDLI